MIGMSSTRKSTSPSQNPEGPAGRATTIKQSQSEHANAPPLQAGSTNHSTSAKSSNSTTQPTATDSHANDNNGSTSAKGTN